MEDSNPTPTHCPECGAPHDPATPFCESCGFRVGRGLDTALEGHRPPKAADVDAVREAIGPRHASSDAATVREAPAVTPEDLARHSVPRDEPTAMEGHRAIRVGDPHNTVNEGMRSVAAEEDASGPIELPPPTGFVPRPKRDSEALVKIPAAREAEERRRTPIWGALWVCSLVAVGMAVWWYATPSGTNATAEIESATTRQPLEVPAGPYLRGLSESVRSFVLTACLSQADDKDRCEQDELLEGEFPEETVELDAYAIDSLEVTLDEWNECKRGGACAAIDFKNCKVYTSQGLQPGLRVPKTVQDRAHPAVCVTREEAAAFCTWAGGALPDHDQWERAARGKDGRLFPWGIAWDPKVLNWGEVDVARVSVAGHIDGGEWSLPPGAFPDGKSAVGAYDMAGNVFEWVSDGDQLRGFARGGSWASSPFDVRTTGRLELKSDARRADVGFRCAYPR